MPSVIGSPGAGYVDVAQNYRQQNVPFSRFGTRKIAWFKIGALDIDGSDGVLDMAEFNKVIDVIQTRAEIVTIGAPYIVNDSGWNKFMIAVFEDTFNNGHDTSLDGLAQSGNSGYNHLSSTLQDALQAATDNYNLYVERFYLYGAPAGGDNYPTGFAAHNRYREYDYKTGLASNPLSNGAGFEENSYTK